MKFTHNILIIGGIGPQASLKLHEHILDKPATNGAVEAADYPAITNLSIPFPDFISDEKKETTAIDICSIVRYRIVVMLNQTVQFNSWQKASLSWRLTSYCL